MTGKRSTRKGKGIPLSKKRILFYVFAVLLFGFVVYYFSEIEKDAKLILKVNPAWLLLALAAQAGTYFINAIVSRLFLRVFAVRSSISIMKLFQASIVSLFINQTIPSVNLSGNIFYFNFLKKRGVPEKNAYSLLVLDLLTFYTAIVLLILILLVTCLFLKNIPVYFIFIFIGGMIAFVLFALLIGLLGRGKNVAHLLRRFSKVRFLKKSITKFSSIPFESIQNPWQTYRENMPVAIYSVLLQSAVFLADSLTIYALFHGLGIPVSFLPVMIGLVLTKIISLLPFTPGALILYEGSMAFFYVKLGIPVAVAAVVILLYRALSFWLPIPVGFFLYRKLEIEKNA